MIQDDVLDQIAIEDFVELACEWVRREVGDRIARQTRWFAGIATVQTASMIFGTLGLIEILK